MPKKTLEFIRGDTKPYQYEIRDPVTKALIDVRGHYLYFTVKAGVDADDINDADAIIAIKQVLPNNSEAQNGIAKLTVPSNMTDVLEVGGEYTYDFQYVVPGVPPYVQTLDRGKLKVVRDVTITNT